MANASVINEWCRRCRWFYLPPIYLCPKWHNICNHCKILPKHQFALRHPPGTQEYEFVKQPCITTYFCYKCMKFYPRDEDERNTSLEHKVKTLTYPCVYHEEGCKFTGTYIEMENHSKTCDFVCVKCPFPNCRHVHMIQKFKDHLFEAHELLSIDTPTLLINGQVYGLIVGDEFFLMKCRKMAYGFDIWVGYFGPSFKYTFQIFIGTKDNFYLKSYDFLPCAEYLIIGDEIPLKNYDMFSFPYAYLRRHVDHFHTKDGIYFKVRAIENEEEDFEEFPPERPHKVKRTIGYPNQETVYYNNFKDAVPPPPPYES